MTELERDGDVCPHCGYDNTKEPKGQPDFALPCGAILNGRYVVGHMLGRGGFGITYIAYDLKLDTAVCIKEYFPDGAAMRSRVRGPKVEWAESQQAQTLKQRRESFLGEARKAAELNDLKHTVKIWNAFYENETSYIVMDYIEGVTLKQRITQTGKPYTEKECMKLLTPVIRDVERLHAYGLIHRDISPDNLMVRPDGSAVLLDFGGIKEPDGGNVSFTMTKQAYSPLEQYTVNGRIGPWTDVYAMCATIYYCVTGKTPPDPAELVNGKKLDTSMLTPGFAEMLTKGMAVQPDDRTRSMGELLMPQGTDPGPRSSRKGIRIAAVVIAAAILAAAALWVTMLKKGNTETNVELTAESTATPAPTDLTQNKDAPLMLDVEQPDYSEEIEKYKKAAEQGDNAAKANLGDAYFEGNDVQQDYEQALSWYLEAMSGTDPTKIDPSLLYRIGYIYEFILQDKEQAVEWYTTAAENGSNDAEKRLEEPSLKAIVEEKPQKEEQKPQTTQAPQVTQAPQASAPPQVTQAPQATNAPQENSPEKQPDGTSRDTTSTPPVQSDLTEDGLKALNGQYGETEYMRGGANPYYLDKPVVNCSHVRMDLSFEQLSGSGYGYFYLYVKDLDGNWHHVALFRIEKEQADGRTVTYELDLEGIESFVAIAICPEEKGMDFVCRYNMTFYVDPDCISEYGANISRPSFTPARSDSPVSSTHAQGARWGSDSEASPFGPIIDALLSDAMGEYNSDGGVCFVSGTLIHTEAGLKPIEEIKQGDMVWSWNDTTSEAELKPVVETYINPCTELAHLSVCGETITCTPEHRFYVPQKGWTRACALHEGDELVLLSGKTVRLDSIRFEQLESPVDVYNFQVLVTHSYYVGETGVRVHNVTIPTEYIPTASGYYEPKWNDGGIC